MFPSLPMTTTLNFPCTPYALATAWALPARVEAVAVVCGAPPFAELPSMEGLLPAYRALVRKEFDGLRALFGEYQQALARTYVVPKVPDPQ